MLIDKCGLSIERSGSMCYPIDEMLQVAGYSIDGVVPVA